MFRAAEESLVALRGYNSFWKFPCFNRNIILEIPKIGTHLSLKGNAKIIVPYGEQKTYPPKLPKNYNTT